MKTFKNILFSIVLVFLCAPLAFSRMPTQLGFGYGQDIRGDKNIDQYEVSWREPLTYTETLFEDWKVTAILEFSWALIKEEDSNSSGTARLSLMPQLVLSPHDMINFIAGFGAGFMAGTTEFTSHNLGGPFLFASKLGAQLVLGEHWGLESVYYHQSNAGLYEYNASLNIILLACTYKF
jgi:hypothetical protein